MVLQSLIDSNYIDDIIISNGKLNTAVVYNHPKVRIFDDVENNKSHGLDLRFLRMIDCKNENVIIIDDDMIIKESELKKIFMEYEKNQKRVVGSFGRNMKKNGGVSKFVKFINFRKFYSKKYTTQDVYGNVDVVLTKLLVCQKKLAYLFFYCKPLVEDIYKKGIPYGNGEDIFFSYITSLYYDQSNFVVKNVNIKEIGNDNTAISAHASHHRYRDNLCEFLYSNKLLFKAHIKNFVFPESYIEETDKQVIEQPSKKLILTISLGKSRNFLEITEKYMKNYAERCGADLVVLNDNSGVILHFNEILDTLNLKSGRNYGGNSYYLKILLIHYYLEDYDKVLWLDDSSIVSSNTESLFDMVKRGSVGGFNEGSNRDLKSWKHDFNFIKMNKNFKIDTRKYLNSGIVLYTKPIRYLLTLDNIKSHKKLFESPYPHQCYLNYILQSNNIPIVCFHNKYNDMFLHYDYLKNKNNPETYIDQKYIKEHTTSIFHITGWWKNRYDVLKNIDDVIARL